MDKSSQRAKGLWNWRSTRLPVIRCVISTASRRIAVGA